MPQRRRVHHLFGRGVARVVENRINHRLLNVRTLSNRYATGQFWCPARQIIGKRRPWLEKSACARKRREQCSAEFGLEFPPSRAKTCLSSKLAALFFWFQYGQE